MKGLDRKLQNLKTIQDATDDDLDVDITKRHHAQRAGQDGGAQGDEDSKDSSKDTRNLLILIGSVIAVIAVILLIIYLTKPPRTALTIDEMHELNSKGKLEMSQGYLYNGFSFVQSNGIWYSQVQKGNTLYDTTFNSDPLSVENITVEGSISALFKNADVIYITFDPDAHGLKYIAVANAGLSMSLVKGFGYNLTAGCTSNETATCRNTAVVQCGDEDKAVIYFKESTETKVVLSENCVTIEGAGEDIIRAKDRLLMRWYGIMQ